MPAMIMSGQQQENFVPRIPPRVNFAELCKFLRSKLGYTQQAMADLLEVKIRHYQRWESGRFEPNGQAAAKLIAVRDQLENLEANQ